MVNSVGGNIGLDISDRSALTSNNPTISMDTCRQESQSPCSDIWSRHEESSKATNRCDCSYGSLGERRPERCGLHLARQKTELNHFIGIPQIDKQEHFTEILDATAKQRAREEIFHKMLISSPFQNRAF